MKSFILILLACSYLSAEFTFQYAPENGNVADFTTSHVSSDFGQRCIKRNSVWRREWHKGDHLLAISGGNIIQLFVSATNNYKFIAIDGPNNLDYGYGHIFYDGHPDAINVELSGMKLLRMESPFNHLF